MDLLTRLWSQKATRSPLIVLGLIVGVSFLWLLSSVLTKAPTAPKVENKTVEIVVKGKVDLRKLPSDQETAFKVHVNIPELAYQADILLTPDSDGTFELPVKVRTDQGPLTYTVDASLGDKRWNVVPTTRLTTVETNSVVEIEEFQAEPPTNSKNLRGHLVASKGPDQKQLRQRQERRQKTRELRESRRQQRQARRPQR